MTTITSRSVLVPGIEFTFRGIEPDESDRGGLFVIDLIVPPLNLGALQALQPRLQTLDGAKDSQAAMETLVDSLELALKRNYTNVPRWLLEQTIDLANMTDLMRALMDISGLRRKEIEDEKKAKAAAMNGATSSPTSSPPAVTTGIQ